MFAVLLSVAALGTTTLPSQAQHLTVSDHGRQLRRVYDPAYDTCSNQWAYVNRKGQTEAEYVGCWHELDNWTDHKLVIRFRRKEG